MPCGICGLVSIPPAMPCAFSTVLPLGRDKLMGSVPHIKCATRARGSLAEELHLVHPALETPTTRAHRFALLYG
jgi:hypothetical protein